MDEARRDRRALRSLAVQFFVNGVVYATFIARLPTIRDRVGISVGALGVVLTIGNLSSLLGSFFTPQVIARFTSRRVMVGGGLAYVAALPVIGLSTAPAVLVVGLVVLMWFDVYIDVAMSLQGSVVSARRSTPVMSRLAGLWSLGTVVGGGVAAGVAAAGIGPAVHFGAIAAVLVGALAFVATGLLPTDEAHPDQHVLPEGVDRRRSLWRFVIAIGVANAATLALDVTSGEWATFRLTDDLGASASTAAAAFVAFTAGMTIGRLAGDLLVVRTGRLGAMRLGALTGAVGLCIAAAVPTQWISIGGFLMTGLGTSVLGPQLADAAARAPGPPGSGFRVLFVGHRAATLATPLAIGLLANTDALSIGTSMLLVGLPAAATVLLVARRAVSPHQ